MRAKQAVVALLLVLAHSRSARAQQGDQRPWLGVAMGREARGAGAHVEHVVHGSPADRAGLREGDTIVRVGDALVARASDVIRDVATHGVGEVVEIVFVRGDTPERASITLEPFPSVGDLLRRDLVGAAAPGWSGIESVSGTFPASLASLHGRVVLVDFWATWCLPCRVSMPELDALQKRYGARGVTVLGVSTEDPATLSLFAQRMGTGYAIGADGTTATTRAYGVMSLPTLVTIDKRGIVRDVAVGYDPAGAPRLDALVKALLAESAEAP